MTETGPEVEYDLQIASMTYTGSADDSFEEIHEEALEDLETLVETVEELKEMDHKLEREVREEFGDDDSGVNSRTFG